MLGHRADSDEEVKVLLAKRERIFSVIFILWRLGMASTDIEDFSFRVEKELSVIYGRSKRPVLIVGSRGPSGLFSLRLADAEGSRVLENYTEETVTDMVRGLLIPSPQPSPYLLERNVREEPLWLVDAVGGCFEHPDPHLVFPETDPERQEALGRLCECRSFHSPSLSDADCLQAVMYIFDSLNLLEALQVDRGNL